MVYEEVHGYDAYIKALENMKDKKLFLLFSGDIVPETGKSWCPDCSNAVPMVIETFQKISPDATLLHVTVGSRDIWKDKTNSFRVDNNCKLNSIPTLMLYGSNGRLEEEQCACSDQVKKMFES